MTKQFLEKQEAASQKTLDILKKSGVKEEDYRYHIENFLQALIMQIDRRELEMCEQSETAKDEDIRNLYQDFYRCAQFIDLLKLFYQTMPPEWAEKRSYCLFKAGFARCPKSVGGSTIDT